MKQITSLLFSIIICFSCSHAQTWSDTLKKIEAILDRYPANGPGCELAISRGGNLLYSGARGMADLDHNIPLTTTSLTEAGSVSKQFTAAAILLLEQQGKLSLNDDVHKYIPELPDYGKTITLQHLMHHTSGLRDWGTVMELSGWPRTSRNYTNAHALLIIARQKALNNNPGEEFIYSNTNYTLLTIIVERVSGKSLPDFTRENIFIPAGMTHTQWRTNMNTIVPNRAIAYDKTGNRHEINMPNESVYGHAGLLTTAEDLLAWNAFYWAGKMGNPSLLNRQLATTPFIMGTRNNYAAGLFIDSMNGWNVVHHNGATAGYRSNLIYYPGMNLSIAWLSNTDEFDNDTPSVATAISRLFVPDNTPKKAISKNNNNVAPLPEATLKTFTGWYKNEATGQGLNITLQNGVLYNGKNALRYVSDKTFAMGRLFLIFSTDPKRHVELVIPTGAGMQCTAVDDADINNKTMREYSGDYYSSEAEGAFIIMEKNGQLHMVQQPTIDYTLTPAYKDGFTTPFGPLFFERDTHNAITGFKISLDRARKVEFVRKG